MITVKQLTIKDLNDIVRVEEESWEEELRASRETFIERLERFPQGFLGAYVDERLAGMTYGHPIREVRGTWYDNSCKEVFNENGKFFYIVNVGVSRYYQRVGVGSRLLEENITLARRLGFSKIVLGSRNLESNVALYRKNGFREVERIEGYFPEDKASGGIGIIMEFTL